MQRLENGWRGRHAPRGSCWVGIYLGPLAATSSRNMTIGLKTAIIEKQVSISSIVS